MDIGYLAGLLDGEGSILLAKKGPGRNRAPVLQIGMTDEDVVLAVRDAYGGFVQRKERGDGRRVMFVWTVSGFRALDLLAEMRTHLVIDRRRALADLLVDDPILRSTAKGPGSSKVRHSEALFREMRRLNAIRRTVVPDFPRKRPQERDYAYLAGILDGEGCISFERRRMEMFSTDFELPAWLKSRFGGHVYFQPSRRPRQRAQARWARSPSGCDWAARVADLMLLERKADELRPMQDFERTPAPAASLLPTPFDANYKKLREAGVLVRPAIRESGIPRARARQLEKTLGL